jgi:hypothetical protein
MSWDDEFVTVVNETDQPIEWNGNTYYPGHQRVVPYLMMVNSFGDPRSLPGRHQIIPDGEGQRAVVPPREDEMRRLNVAWQLGTEFSRTIDDIPQLVFKTMDGDRLYTVRDDIAGDNIAAATPTVEEHTAMAATIRRQQEQIGRLLEIAGLDKDALPTDPSSPPLDIPVDDSTASNTQSPWAHSDEVTNEVG